MAEHTVDGQIGLAGVRGAEDGRHPAFREERHVTLENRSCPNPLQGIPVPYGPHSSSRGGVTSGTKATGRMTSSVRPPSARFSIRNRRWLVVWRRAPSGGGGRASGGEREGQSV